MTEHELSPPATAASPLTATQVDSLVAKLSPARQAVAIAIQTGEAALLLDSLAAGTPVHREKQDEIAHLGALLLREQAARVVPDATLCRHMARSFLGRFPLDAKLGVLCLLLAQDHAQALEAALQACADALRCDDPDPHIIHAIVASAALGRPAGELPGLRHQLYVLEVETLAAALAPLPPAALAAIASTLEPLSAVALFVWMRTTPWPAVLIALERLVPGRLILAEELPQMHTATDAVRQQLLARVLLRGMAVPAALHAVENSLRRGGDAAALQADPFLGPLGAYPEYRSILMPEGALTAAPAPPAR